MKLIIPSHTRTIKIIYHIIFFSLIFTLRIQGEVPLITFTDLEKGTAEERIQIRGFIQVNDRAEIFLAPMPNIKNCCVSNYPTIMLEGFSHHNSSQKAILFEGKLVQSDEQPYPKYILKQICLISENTNYSPFILTIILILLIIGCYILISKYLYRKSYAPKY
jgi:hypothetical protein